MKKSQKDSRVYLQDILSAIERIGEYLSSGKDFFTDGLLQDGIIRNDRTLEKPHQCSPVPPLLLLRRELPAPDIIENIHDLHLSGIGVLQDARDVFLKKHYTSMVCGFSSLF